MITELRTFIAAADAGTFAGAGERVGLTQAAVSGQIRRLEAALGFELFDRTGRSAILNGAGARTLSRAKRLVEDFDTLGAPEGTATASPIKLGAIASVQSSLLQDAFVTFRDRFPDVAIQVAPGVSLHLLDRMDAGDLDLAIMIRPPFGLPPAFSWHLLTREPYELVVPAELEGQDWRRIIAANPFLRYDRSSFGGRTVEQFLARLQVPVIESIEIDDIAAMIALVGRGLGVAILPMAAAYLPLPANVRAVPLAGKALFREIGIVRTRRPETHPSVEYLVECLLR